jgi:hypothetical protein
LWLAALALSAVTAPAGAQELPDMGDSPVAAGQMIARIREAARSIADLAGPEFRDSAAAAVAGLTDLADRLEAVLPVNANASLAEPRDDLRDAVAQGEAALVIAEDFAKLLRRCIREDLGTLLSAFHENLRRTIGEPDSWSGGTARILRVESAGDGLRGSIRAGTAGRLHLEGSNLDSSACGPAEATITLHEGQPVQAAVTVESNRALSVDMPALEKPGLYELSIRLRRRKLLFFCGSRTASMAVAVHASAPIGVRWAVSTTMSTIQQITWDAGELKQANASCNGDTIASALFRLPDGWTYRAHEWTVFLNTGAEKIAEEVRGSGVRVAYRIPPKAGPFCSGLARLIHGKMTIHGVRTNAVAGPSLSVARPLRLAFGETVAVPVEIDAPAGAEISGWTIDVTFLYPDGTEHGVTRRTGSGRLAGAWPGGGSFTWDPESRRLTVSAPARACRIAAAPPIKALRP